jgi:hypothetical protein
MSARADLCGGRSAMIVPTATRTRTCTPFLRISEIKAAYVGGRHSWFDRGRPPGGRIGSTVSPPYQSAGASSSCPGVFRT